MLEHAVPLGLMGYLWDFARSVLALLGALGLAYVATRALGVKGRLRTQGPVEVLQRVALEPRKSLYLVQVEGRRLLIGCGDGSAPALIAELAPNAGPAAAREATAAGDAGAAPGAGA